MRALTNYYGTSPWAVIDDNLLNVLAGSSLYRDAEPTASPRTHFPAGEVQESEREYRLSFDLPGIRPEDLRVEFKDGLLSVAGDRKPSEGNARISGRKYGSFARSFSIPEEINEERIEASYDLGVLRVTLPKAEKKAGKKIEIQFSDTSTRVGAPSAQA
jgi:HSP20 family protein